MSLITQPMLEIKVTDGRAGEGPPWMLHFDHAEIEESMGFMCEDRYLRSALLAAMDIMIASPNCPAKPSWRKT
jgi:2-octaprenyl-6-methoxyphenol hydroxylase